MVGRPATLGSPSDPTRPNQSDARRTTMRQPRMSTRRWMLAVAVVALLLGIGVDVVRRRERARQRRIDALITALVQSIADEQSAAVEVLRARTEPPPSPLK